MDERKGSRFNDEWYKYWRKQESLHWSNQALDASRKSPTLSIANLRRNGGYLAACLVLIGILSIIPNIGGRGNINLKEGSASMQSRTHSDSYQIDSQEALRSFAIQNSEEVPLYILRSTRDRLSLPNPNMGDKAPLQIYQELGLKPQRGEDLLDKNLTVTGKQGNLIMRAPIPVPAAYEVEDKYGIIIGELKKDNPFHAYYILPLLDPQKSLVQFLLLIDPYDLDSRVKDQAPPTWMQVAEGQKDGSMNYDKYIVDPSQKLQGILQRLLAAAFSKPIP